MITSISISQISAYGSRYLDISLKTIAIRTITRQYTVQGSLAFYLNSKLITSFLLLNLFFFWFGDIAFSSVVHVVLVSMNRVGFSSANRSNHASVDVKCCNHIVSTRKFMYQFVASMCGSYDEISNLVDNSLCLVIY